MASGLGLGTIAIAALAAVFMVTALPAATGDNVADAVLGQIDFAHNPINNANAASLDSPSQMVVDLGSTPEHLYVVDGSNNRILGWNDASGFSNGQSADLEIGQPDFRTTRCNSGSAVGNVAGLGADSLCLPGGVAVDGAGNLYVADTGNNRVLEYNPPFAQAIASGFAANAVFGQGGSFVQAACAAGAAGLCFPEGVATDASDNLYVADAGNNRVLEFNQPLAAFNAVTGAGDTIADLVFGQGASGADFAGNVCDINSGSASAVGMCNPLSVAVDAAGDVYAGDDGDHRVLEFDQPLAAPNIVTGVGDVTADRVFGQGSGATNFTASACYDGQSGNPAPSADGLCDLSGLALDGSGDLFVTDINNSRVLEYLNPIAGGGGTPGTPGSAGDVTADVVFGQNGSFSAATCGGANSGGIAASGAVLCQPDGVAVDGAGDVFVADASNSRILKYVSPLSSPPVAAAVLGQLDLLHDGIDNPTLAALEGPQGVAIDSSGGNNRLYVADSGNSRVLGWASAAAFLDGSAADIVIGQPDARTVGCNDGVGVGDANGAGADSLCNPADVAVDGSGNLYVADTGNNRVLEYLTPFGISSPVAGQSASQVWGQNGSFTTVGCNFGNATISGLSMCSPAGLTVDTAGNLYVSDTDNMRVLEFNSGDTVADRVFGQGGIFTTQSCNLAGVNANSLCTPRGLATDSSGDLFVADHDNSRVLEFNQPLAAFNALTGAGDTTADRVFGQGGGGASFTTAVCASSAGPAPSATAICDPVAVSLDSPGNLIVADAYNNRVLEYNQPLAAFNAASGAGNVTADLVLGQGASGTDFVSSVCADAAFGDPVPSASALCQPGGVAMDAIGNLYVADQTNNRVLRFDDPIVPFTGATPTASATATGSTPTATPTATASGTAIATPTATATTTASSTATSTASATASGTTTPTSTATSTASSTNSATPTASGTATTTVTATATATPSDTATATQTASSSATATATATASSTATATSSATATATTTQTATATASASPTATSTATPTATATATPSPVRTPVASATATSTATASATTTPTATPTVTPVPIALKVSPHALKLGKVVFGAGKTGKPKKITIANKSKTTPVTFSGIATTGDFAIVNGCGATIGPKRKCSVTVTFKPTALGTRGGTLTVSSNADNSPSSVGLSGIATQAKK